MAATHTFEFKAEVAQVLKLMIESLYTQRDIFLRELISNASDALDTLRFTALTQPDLLTADDKLEIRLQADRERRTLTVADTGIGMTREDLISNIGTIARSGTGELRDRSDPAASPVLAEMIGRFGVGFYSAFMVADRVSLLTRHASEASATLWESSGGGTYTIEEAHKPERGTTVVLHLKEPDAEKGIEDYTDSWVLTRIVKQYSDFITYPIILKAQREEVGDGAAGTRDGTTAAPATVMEERTLNSMKPLWARRADSVTKEEYAECYEHLFHDWTTPLETIHFEAEGASPYQALLFVPSQASSDLYYAASEYGLRLYANRVLVMERCEALLPRYLRFIKGVIDADLPLNISRQRWQQDHLMVRVRRRLTRKVLDALASMFEKDKPQYLEFWRHFGRALKEGVGSDPENRDRILPLLLFQSSNDAEKLTTLGEYVARMRPDQDAIWYLTGPSRSAVESSPHLERVTQRGHEVLYLTEGVDELLLQYLHEFDGRKLKSVGKGPIGLGTAEEREETKRELEALQQDYQGLLDLVQRTLESHVKRVCLTNRLTTSAVCLVVDEHDYSPMLERALRTGSHGPGQRRVMELNPAHPLIGRLRDRCQNNPEDPSLADAIDTLFGLALLAEGSPLVDSVRFGRAASALLERAL